MVRGGEAAGRLARLRVLRWLGWSEIKKFNDFLALGCLISAGSLLAIGL